MAREEAVKDIVVLALEALERGGMEAVDALLVEHPGEAQEVRRRLDALQDVGFVGSAEPAARTVGRYRLVRQLGAGGMGVVHLAHDEKLDRLVALKMLPLSLGLSMRARERFRREARAVARLDHPGIVPIYETGELEGAPFFTMRYVEGSTLAQLLAGLRGMGVPTGELSPRHLSRFTNSQVSSARAAEPADGPERAPATLETPWGRTFVETICRIVMEVAEALEHAHANGVIHRDVKPSNILLNRQGRALLFDFGLARVESDVSLTASGDFAGTPYYVSPEQVAGKHLQIDLRTDVYSLGVTLFELLTLQPPFEGETTNEVLRKILVKEPPRLRRLNAMVPADLETICLTAMEKDPERRYPTAAELSADLGRFLEFHPVKAHPIGPITRGLRAAKRRPAVTLAISLAVILLLGAPTMAFLANERAQRESLLAAQRTSRLLERIIFDADVEEMGPDTPVGEMLLGADEAILSELDDQPIVQGRLLQKLGAFLAVGPRLTKGGDLIAKALSIQLEALGEDHLDTAATLNYLANQRRTLGRLDEAESLYRRSLKTRQARLPPGHADTIAVLANLAGLLHDTGRLDEAEEFCLRIQDLLDRANAPEGINRIINLRQRARIRQDRGDLAGAESLYRQALELSERTLGSKDAQTASVLGGLARTVLMQGQVDAATEIFRRQRDAYASIFGEDHWFVGAAETYIGDAHYQGGDLAKAEEAYARGLQVLEAQLGEDHHEVALAGLKFGRLVLEQGRPDEAEPLLADSLRAWERLGNAARAEEVQGLLKRCKPGSTEQP